MDIIIYGSGAAGFAPALEPLLTPDERLVRLPDALDSAADRERFAAAEYIVGTAFSADLPQPEKLRLFQATGAGIDRIDLNAIPGGAVVCNAFGHEIGIAEFCMAAMLNRVIPMADADAKLRKGEWNYQGRTSRGELYGQTVGLLGFGRIGKAVAERAKAFGMKVTTANRTPVPPSPLVDAAFTLDRLDEFWPTADVIVMSLPLAEGTRGLVDAAAFAAMRPHTLFINVGRGPVVDEQALFDALKGRRIGGAVIDTWYQYPSGGSATLPSRLPFETLDNIVMSPHMSGWTTGTLSRRAALFADNIRRAAKGEPCLNVVRPPRS